MLTPTLETARLILREIHPEDTETIFHCWMRDAEVSRYMWWKASDDFAEAKAFVAFELEQLENDRWDRWIIVSKDSSRILGTCLLFFNEAQSQWDISYNLGRAFWGNGYGTEAMQAVLAYAVDRRNIREIVTTYAAENQASGHLLQKLGFRFVKEVPYTCSGGDLVTTGKLCRYKA